MAFIVIRKVKNNEDYDNRLRREFEKDKPLKRKKSSAKSLKRRAHLDLCLVIHSRNVGNLEQFGVHDTVHIRMYEKKKYTDP